MKVNYETRPAKYAERRMILSGIQDIKTVLGIKGYRYFGMGSAYFTDFKLFHKELRINKMTSIEGQESLEERIRFNLPFNCIDIQMLTSTKALSSYQEWEEENIFWMDYEDSLESYMFKDCELIFQNISKNSIYLFTCQGQFQFQNEDKFLKNFRRKFGEVVPLKISMHDFNAPGRNNLIREMILNKIQSVLKKRNIVLDEESQLLYQQLFYFTYRDGAPMITFGGIVTDKQNLSSVKEIGVENSDIFRLDKDRFNIKVPNLTTKEIELLNSCLPEFSDKEKDILKFIPESDQNSYKSLYRYLPVFRSVIN